MNDLCVVVEVRGKIVGGKLQHLSHLYDTEKLK